MTPRWLNARQAAEYCGYSSPDHFRRLAIEHEIPRYGPGGNRYDRLELDEWMRSPRVFMAQQAPRRRVSFTPVTL